MDPITAHDILDEIRNMRADNREDFAAVREENRADFTDIRKQIAGLVAKPDCDNCKNEWQASISTKMSKREFVVALSTVVAIGSTLSVLGVFLAIVSGLVKFMTP